MNIFTKTIAFIAIVITFTSCASIVSSSKWPLTVKTTPAGAQVQIINRRGISVFTGQTPATLLLKSGAGFFANESYMIKLTMPGYAEKTIPVKCSLNGWYFGNILFGGLIGLLIVDPATGAMYRLDVNYIDEPLTPTNTTADKGQTLKIMDINDLSQDMRSHLVSLK